jgi:hypothetical protein
MVPLTVGDEIPDAQGRSDVCTVHGRPDDFSRGGGLPVTPFSGPGQPTPSAAYGDAVEAGWVVIRYRSDLAAASVSALRTCVTDPATKHIVAGADPGVKAITASAAGRTQICTDYDVDALVHFTADRLGA